MPRFCQVNTQKHRISVHTLIAVAEKSGSSKKKRSFSDKKAGVNSGVFLNVAFFQAGWSNDSTQNFGRRGQIHPTAGPVTLEHWINFLEEGALFRIEGSVSEFWDLFISIQRPILGQEPFFRFETVKVNFWPFSALSFRKNKNFVLGCV